MTKTTDFCPNWVSAPGRTIAELLRHKMLSVEDFAKCVCLDLNEVNHLLNGRLPITLDTAERLQRAIGGTIEFWLARDYQYREDSERLFAVSREWIRQLPVSDMRRFGWFDTPPTPANEEDRCLEFFNVRTVQEWHETYGYLEEAVLFRKSKSFESRTASVAAWLRQGEREAARLKTKSWDVGRFQAALVEAKKLTREKAPDIFLPQLRDLCAGCGVSLVIVRTPSGCPASGATRFLNDQKALLMLSFRHLTDDHFWFSFFHEAAHLILHHPHKFFVEGVGDAKARREIEADDFAQNLIVPLEHRKELMSLKSRSLDIIRFARKVGVSPGLIVGQLQYFQVLSFSQQNRLKRRYEWT